MAEVEELKAIQVFVLSLLARLDSKGAVATLLVQQGTYAQDPIAVGNTFDVSVL